MCINNTLEDIKSFVALKYSILTSDESTWHLCDTYPAEVRKSWAWRCAEDVEHLATTKESKELYRVARLYRDGLATEEELDKAAANYAAYAYNAAAYAAHAAAYAAHAAYYAAANAAYAANRAAANAAYAANRAATKEEKWKLYISWLVEELCKYEEQQ